MKKKILFSVIAIVLFFVLVEITFRIIFFVKYGKYGTSVKIQGSSLQMADDLLIYRNRPFYLDKNKKHQFNNEGFKSRAGDIKMPEKAANDFWVFLFGASAMEGMGSNKDGEWLDITGVPDYSYEESIAFQLQQELQRRIPDRNVRVFSAANSGFCIYQGLLQYERLKGNYKMDWIISLDGNNEPMMNDSLQSVRSIIEADWSQYPIFKYPLKYVIPITRHSAFINSLKQALFETKMKDRIEKASKQGYPARQKWMNEAALSLRYDSNSLDAKSTVDSFFYYAKKFDATLTQDGVPHLLFVQPHLTMRDRSKSSAMEKALLNYYCSTEYNNAAYNTMIKSLHQHALADSAGPVKSLSFMHGNNIETFVDYCHFTRQAIQQLAAYFADRIVDDYQSKKQPQ